MNTATTANIQNNNPTAFYHLPGLFEFTTVVMVTHEHDLVRSFQRRVIVIQKGQVVSDTPDPTFAKFKAPAQEKATDMFYYEEDVKQKNVSEVYNSLEEIADSTSDKEDESNKGGEE